MLNKAGVLLAAISQALLLAACNAPPPRNTMPETPNANVSVEANSTRPVSPPTPQSNWVYRTERDEARNSEIRFATITSSNEVEFGPPYAGGSSAQMIIRRHPEHGLDIIFTVSPGQLICDVSYGCRALINIDGRQQRIRLLMPADYNSEQLFVSGAQSLLAQIRRSHRVIIELSFYQEGNRQFTFDTTGLEWDENPRRSNRSAR